MGLGITLAKHGELGVSPISSVANVVSLKFFRPILQKSLTKLITKRAGGDS